MTVAIEDGFQDFYMGRAYGSLFHLRLFLSPD
jgi:hypothetical protein